ncbi:MAG: spheroidene monooxygenase [Rhodothalassiaceae bacterium]
MQTATLSLFRYQGPTAKLWAFSQMGFARRPLARTPDLQFCKLFGSGTGEGFNPKPNFGVYAVLAVWPDAQVARDRLAGAPIYQRFYDHAAEHWTAYLQATRCWGSWDGRAPFAVADTAPPPRPVAVLTRATLKLRHLPAFWRQVPSISADIPNHPSMMLKIGIGEVPWIHQVTFSIWPDTEAMLAFSQNKAAHGEGVRRAWAHGWFKEQLFARFAVIRTEGAWEGRDPLARAMVPPVAA